MDNIREKAEDIVKTSDIEINKKMIQDGNNSFSKRFSEVINRIKDEERKQGIKRQKSGRGYHVTNEGFSQEKLAEQLGIDPVQVSQYKTGKRLVPEFVKKQIADILNVRIEYLNAESSYMFPQDYEKEVELWAALYEADEKNEENYEERINHEIKRSVQWLVDDVIPLELMKTWKDTNGQERNPDFPKRIMNPESKVRTEKFEYLVYDISQYIKFRIEREMQDMIDPNVIRMRQAALKKYSRHR